jgi:uncharacterized protein (DUF1778 family)
MLPEIAGAGDAWALYYGMVESYHASCEAGGPMRSVRFDTELEGRVERAAKRRGVTVSDFIRAAVRRECDEVLDGEEHREDWKAMLAGTPHGQEWIRALDGIVGAVEGAQDEDLDDWARTIREHNWRQ